MIEGESNLYIFEGFTLDTGEKILRREITGEIIPLAPKVLDVLCLLVLNHGKIVTKNDLMETVWNDSFVEESNLTQSIYTLRRVFGKSDSGAKFIETVPRRGYRFSANVEVLSDTNEKDYSENISVELRSPETFENKFENIGQKKTKNETFFTRGNVFLSSIVLLLILFFGVSAAYFYSSKTKAGVSLENVTFEKLTFSGDIATPVISPDGKTFAYIRDEGIYLQDIGSGNSFKLNIPDIKVFGNLQFSVDGEMLFFRDENSTDAGGTLFQVSRFGGAAKKIAEDVWSTPGFSPDGKSLAFMRFNPASSEWALIVGNFATGEEKKMLTRGSPYTLYRTGFPAWSRDGKKIATVEQTPDHKNISKLIIIDSETGATETLETPRLIQIEQVAWQKNDEGLVLVGREDGRFFQLWKIAYPNGELQKITNDLNIYRTISLSADGTKLLAREQTIFSHIWTANADAPDVQKQVTFGNLNRDGINEGMMWLNDSQTIVYSSRITGNVDLWSVRPADGVRRQLTKNAGTLNESPAVSPDGKHIYFSSTRTGKRHIWRIETGGENPSQETFDDKEMDFYPEISPDGKWLYFIKKAENKQSVWRKSLATGEFQQVTQNDKFSPNSFLAFTPDGKFLAFKNFIEKGRENSGGKNMQVAVISSDDQIAPRFFNVAATVSKIAWTNGGASFDYIQNSPEGAKLWRQFLEETKQPELLFSIPNTHLYDFAWSKDEKNLALARGKQESDVILFQNF